MLQVGDKIRVLLQDDEPTHHFMTEDIDAEFVGDGFLGCSIGGGERSHQSINWLWDKTCWAAGKNDWGPPNNVDCMLEQIFAESMV